MHAGEGYSKPEENKGWGIWTYFLEQKLKRYFWTVPKTTCYFGFKVILEYYFYYYLTCKMNIENSLFQNELK